MDEHHKKRSPWTSEFTKCDATMWKCNICKTQVRAKDGNTTNLKNHVKNHHKDQFDDIMRRIAASEIKTRTVSCNVNYEVVFKIEIS